MKEIKLRVIIFICIFLIAATRDKGLLYFVFDWDRRKQEEETIKPVEPDVSEEEQ